MTNPTADELVAHSRFVHALARSLMFDQHEAADVAQDALVIVLKNGAARRSTRAWLAGVVRNRARVSMRSRQRRKSRERKSATDEVAPPAAEALAQLEIQKRLVDAVGQLDRDYRTIIVLRFFEGLPPRRIARRLGLPVETVKSRQKRGLALLRGTLDRVYGGRRAWCMVLASLALTRPVAAATAAVGGTSQLVIGGMAMKTGTVVAGALVVSTAVVAVVLTPRGEEEVRRTPETRAVESRGVDSGPREMAPGVEMLDELHETTRAPTERLRAIEASEDGEEAAPKSDPITRRYLDELVAAYRRLPEGEERAGVLRTFATTYKHYAEATGDRSLDVFLVEVLDRSAHKEERNATAEALVGRRPPAPRLLRLMESPYSEVRTLVASRLAWVFGDDRPRAIERLYPALDDKDPMVRYNAALGLSIAAPDARTFEAVLDRLAREQDQSVAYPLARAALKIDREEGRSRLKLMLPALPSDETREIVSKVLQRAE